MSRNRTGYSKVNGIEFPFDLAVTASYYVRSEKLDLIGSIKFWVVVWKYRVDFFIKLFLTLSKKVCYYGPFKGEFGHFLAHNLPFLMYLHHKGVKIIYCGMELHSPLLIDDYGGSIISDYRPLRDFFSEVSPTTNATNPPKDVQNEIELFKIEAIDSDYPFWNIDNDFYYWFVHRQFVAKWFRYNYNFSKSVAKEKCCCVFPRSKGAKESKNNGESWDYDKIIDVLVPYFDKIYVCGHPSQVLELKPRDKVEIRISENNNDMLECCSKSELIVTQHSGIVYMAAYVRAKVMLIYKGGKKISDIGSFNNTLYFLNSLGKGVVDKFEFAFTYEDIKNKIEKRI